jgi:hypothetical protein
MRRYRLPDTQRFACSRKAVKEIFGEDLASVRFWTHKVCLDPRSSLRRAITGPVVASMTVDRVQRASLYLYAVPRAMYPDAAVSEFSDLVLPQFRDWLTKMHARVETEILGHESLFAEWSEGGHRLHHLRS